MSAPRLVVLAGPANTGKTALANAFLHDDPFLVLVSRDDLREAVRWNGRDEGLLTWLMADVARFLLHHGIGVVVKAQNLEQIDRDIWLALAVETRARLTWVDSRAAWARLLSAGEA